MRRTGSNRTDTQGRCAIKSGSLSQWLEYIEAQHPQHAIELGLDRVREVAARMSLARPARHVVTVAGTNGKGSTVAFIEAIARASDWRVGAYTSPHLLRYNERVRIDGHDADDAALAAAFDAVEAARRDTPLTYFEYGTLAALWLFQREELDLAILEVGLGGRLDAVNIVDADVAVITTVDIDHTEWLGQDRESIGREKAGIARAWKPLVLGEDDPPSSVLRHAYAIGANALRAGCDFFHQPADAEHWQWRDASDTLVLPEPALRAPAQRANAAAAIAALRALPETLKPEAYAEGVKAAALPGRLQRLDWNGVETVVDVGHNPQAARELARWLETQPAGGRTFAVFAALADKDVLGVVRALEERIDRWYLAGLSVAGRSQESSRLAQRLQGTAAAAGKFAQTVAEALNQARAEVGVGDRILVFGSFHTVAEALAELYSVI